MGKEFERTQRVSHFLHEELARLLQNSVRDPRVEAVSLTGVEVSRDLSHAKVFFTLMDDHDARGALRDYRCAGEGLRLSSLPIGKGVCDANGTSY